MVLIAYEFTLKVTFVFAMAYPDSGVLHREKFYWVKIVILCHLPPHTFACCFQEDHDASAVLFRSQWGFVGFFLFVQAWCFLS